MGFTTQDVSRRAVNKQQGNTDVVHGVVMLSICLFSLRLPHRPCRAHTRALRRLTQMPGLPSQAWLFVIFLMQAGGEGRKRGVKSKVRRKDVVGK